MTTEAVSLLQAMTAEQAVAELRHIGQEVEQVHYVYVVDGSGRLTGVLSMRDIVRCWVQEGAVSEMPSG